MQAVETSAFNTRTALPLDGVPNRSTVRLCAGLLVAYALMITASGDFQPAVFVELVAINGASAFSLWFLLVALIALAALLRGRWFARTRRNTRTPLHDFVRDQWARNRCLYLYWPPLLYTLLLTLFAMFKQGILADAAFSYDTTFRSVDLVLFGQDPWRLSHGQPWRTEFAGMLYYGWYAPMMLGVLVCGLAGARPGFRDQYLLAFVLTWLVVGSLMAYLFPAAGPCFWGDFVAGPNPYADLLASLEKDVALSASYNPVLDAQDYLRSAFGREPVVGGGISAMPSMHVALATLFACAAWAFNRFAGLALSAFAACIWWASVHLGWHYFVDGLVAVPLTIGVWILSGAWVASRRHKLAATVSPAGLLTEAG